MTPPFDSTLALRRDPYRFIQRTCADLRSDSFQTRLMLERIICLSGADAARFFYDRETFTREGAAPAFLKATLFGKGGVQGLDGALHKQRKALFLKLVGPGRTDTLTQKAAEGLADLLHTRGTITLQDATEEVLTAAVCNWAGLPVPPEELPDRARMLSNLFEHAAPVGSGHVLALLSRLRADRWAAEKINAVRNGTLVPSEGSALSMVAGWCDADGTLLAPRIAAVELLNILRPFVAISAFLTFVAHALATRPAETDALRADTTRIPLFVQEVRRTYPFFPLLAARARRHTAWRGHDIPQGRLVTLDIRGTNRDPAVWDNPDAFRPERFENWQVDPYTLIPQGGGEHASGHRCPGEWVTQDLMAECTRMLLDGVDWRRLPEQDLTLDMRRLPALPGDRMVLRYSA